MVQTWRDLPELLKLVMRQITEQAFHDNIHANFQCTTNPLVFMRQHG
jgi:hypothetical protein